MCKQCKLTTFENHIKKICELHKNIKDLNEALEVLQPIAVIDNNVFYIFDIKTQEKNYEFIMEYPSSGLPEKVLAAFPLDFYQEKMAAVVSANELENPDNYVFIFHEFVHCFQWNKYERNIRKELTIEKQNRKVNNFMWEINYPFPYEDDFFISMTAKLNGIPCEDRLESFTDHHKKLKVYLNETDFEYMVWQEWKEGFARYVENLIREKLGMEKNNNILYPPFDRICFYETGSKYIEALLKNDNTLNNDLEKLFNKMMLKL
jgi:hypothetical protein